MLGAKGGACGAKGAHRFRTALHLECEGECAGPQVAAERLHDTLPSHFAAYSFLTTVTFLLHVVHPCLLRRGTRHKAHMRFVFTIAPHLPLSPC